MVRIDLSARRICRFDVPDGDDDESDLGREDDDIVASGESVAADAAAISDTPLMCC